MFEKSCGTIPYTVRDGTVYYLLIKSNDGNCGFPKGHIEANESEEETALRETLEETSIQVQINDRFRYEISYQMKNGNTKTVVYFLANFQSQIPKRNAYFEEFEYIILTFDNALQELTFENARQMLKSANEFLAHEADSPSPSGGRLINR